MCSLLGVQLTLDERRRLWDTRTRTLRRLLVLPRWSAASSLLARQSSMPASSSFSLSWQENSEHLFLPFDFKRVHSLQRESCHVLTFRRKDQTASATNSTQDHVCNLTVLSLRYKAALRNFTNSLEYEQREFLSWGCNVYFQSAYTKCQLIYVVVYIHIHIKKVKCSRYRPGVDQRVGRCIALLFHDRGTRRGWVVNSIRRPHFTPGKDPVPILQEAG